MHGYENPVIGHQPVNRERFRSADFFQPRLQTFFFDLSSRKRGDISALQHVKMLQNILPLTAADAEPLRQRIQILPRNRSRRAVRIRIVQNPDHGIVKIRRLPVPVKRQLIPKRSRPVGIFCRRFFLYVRNGIILGIRRLQIIKIQEGHAEQRRFLIKPCLHHGNHKDPRRQKSQKMLAALDQLIHEQYRKQHGNTAEGKMQLYGQPLPGRFRAPDIPCRLPSLPLSELHRALSEQDYSQNQIPVKVRARRKPRLPSLDHIPQRIRSLIVQRAEKDAEASGHTLFKERFDPVRKKQRCKVFRAEIMLDTGIRGKRHKEDPRRAQRPSDTVPPDPKVSRKQQKQQKIRTHQRHDRCHDEQQYKLIPPFSVKIADRQPIEQDEHAETDNLRHSREQIPRKRRIKTKQQRQNPQLLPCRSDKQNKKEARKRQQNDIADHRREQIPTEKQPPQNPWKYQNRAPCRKGKL